MTEEKKAEGEKKPIVIKLVVEVALNKDGKPAKNRQGNPMHRHHDAGALKQLLSAFDGRKYEMERHKICTKLSDKIDDAWLNSKKEIELSLDQASFLKDYLKNFKDKALPQILPNGIKQPFPITLFLTRTIVSITEQLK